MTQEAVKTKTENEAMFAKAVSSFSVNDLEKAKEFYASRLGLDVTGEEHVLKLQIGGLSTLIYPKDDQAAATFTILNFMVDDIEKAVDEVANRGVKFESYEGEMKTDEKGIFRGQDLGHGPNIAWFKDPAGNVLAIIEE